MKKKEFINSILQKYFTFNGNIATLRLVYDTFDELINRNFGDDKVEKLNDKLFSDIHEAIELLPSKYKLDLQIVIKDYGAYSKEECAAILKQNIQLFVYHTTKAKMRKWISGWTLIGAGALVLLLSYLLRSQGQELWFDLINISGTLCVWEGVNLAFIERVSEVRTAKKIAKMIKDIAINSEEIALQNHSENE